MTRPPAPRSARDVFEDHLRESTSGSVEADLRRNYAEDVVLLTGRGIYRGRDGLRALARRLRGELPNATFGYRTRLVHGEIAFLEWTATSKWVSCATGRTPTSSAGAESASRRSTTRSSGFRNGLEPRPRHGGESCTGGSACR